MQSGSEGRKFQRQNQPFIQQDVPRSTHSDPLRPLSPPLSISGTRMQERRAQWDHQWRFRQVHQLKPHGTRSEPDCGIQPRQQESFQEERQPPIITSDLWQQKLRIQRSLEQAQNSLRKNRSFAEILRLDIQYALEKNLPNAVQVQLKELWKATNQTCRNMLARIQQLETQLNLLSKEI